MAVGGGCEGDGREKGQPVIHANGGMHTRLAHVLAALAVGALLALGLPLLGLWRDCRTPSSEACVWGRAYLPLTLGLGTVIALVVAGIAYLLLRTWIARRGHGHDAD